MEFNLNDIARVTLTLDGHAVLTAWWAGTVDEAEKIPGYSVATGVYETELWAIMNIFGHEMYMGNIRQMFRHNRIEILPQG